jgi:hypothetical protein
METFQKTVLIVAIILLIISLVLIGITLNNAKGQVWPPIVPTCPDYWIVDGSGNNTKCINIQNLGAFPPNTETNHIVMDFNSDEFTGDGGLCAKYNWANSHQISWDGITYGVQNPCDKQT